ncbi:hypothetical protein WR25_07969 isoform B [Diploscapter pachys]|nr:hypothetical protein WR25_07969 isoform B [Diploscapter pachys]
MNEGEIAGIPGQDDENNTKGSVVRLRGLPYSATEDEVKKFFEGLDLVAVKIPRNSTGRSTGEAYVRFATGKDGANALTYNKKSIGNRYIEVFRSSQEEFENNGMLRSGIPSIISSGRMQTSPPNMRGGGRGGSYPNNDYGGKYGNSGSGHGGYNDWGGYNYSRPAPYNVPPARGQRGRPTPGYGGSNYNDYGGFSSAPKEAVPTESTLYLRGLPFDVNARMLEEFFEGLNIMDIKLGYNNEGRLSGDGMIEFSAAKEVDQAMEKNNQKMGWRYIELFKPNDAPFAMRRQPFKPVPGYKASSGSGGNNGFGYGNTYGGDYDDYPSRYNEGYGDKEEQGYGWAAPQSRRGGRTGGYY